MTREYRGFAKSDSANAEIINTRDGFVAGEWLYGYLLENDVEGKTYIVTVSANGGYCMNEVIAETVGQWTGKTDYKGCKIYDGDYVQCAVNYDGHTSDFGIITYESDGAMFMINFKGREMRPFPFYKDRDIAVVGSRWNKPSEEAGGAAK